MRKLVNLVGMLKCFFAALVAGVLWKNRLLRHSNSHFISQPNQISQVTLAL
jgi:hypothetical protein